MGLKKILKRGTKKNLTVNYSTHFYLQNETSSNKIHKEIFEELHRKGGAKCKHEVFRNAPGRFRALAGGAGWGREGGRKLGEGTLLRI